LPSSERFITGIQNHRTNAEPKAWASSISGWFLIGFHLTFDLMHIPGLLGMPRRIYTYEPGRGWDTLNFLVTIGAFVQGIGHAGVRSKFNSFPISKKRKQETIPGTRGLSNGR